MRLTSTLRSAADVGALHTPHDAGDSPHGAPLLALVDILARQLDGDAVPVGVMVERADIALIAREPVQHVNHHGLHLVRHDGVPQAIHARPVQVLAALHLTVHVWLAHLPRELRRVLSVDAFLLR